MRVLLVIDMQEDFFADGPLFDTREQITTSINTIVRYARKSDIPIVWVWQEFSADLEDAFLIMRKLQIEKTISGTFGSQILSELDKRDGDYEVIKKRYSAFFGTDLDGLLASLGATELIITGINTHACVRMAVIDAYQRDYEVIIPAECVLSPDEEHHDVSLRYLGDEIAQVVPLEQLVDSS